MQQNDAASRALGAALLAALPPPVDAPASLLELLAASPLAPERKVAILECLAEGADSEELARLEKRLALAVATERETADAWSLVVYAACARIADANSSTRRGLELGLRRRGHLVRVDPERADWLVLRHQARAFEVSLRFPLAIVGTTVRPRRGRLRAFGVGPVEARVGPFGEVHLSLSVRGDGGTRLSLIVAVLGAVGALTIAVAELRGRRRSRAARAS